MTVCPVAVIGIGNVLLGDEGVGVHVVRALQAHLGEVAGVEFLDLGLGGLGLLHALNGRQQAILVDCTLMDEPPGTLRRFLPAQVRSRKGLARLSLHESDVLSLLELANEMGSAPDQVVLFGIQPAETSPGMALSETLRCRLGRYVETLAAEVRAALAARAGIEEGERPCHL